MSTPIMDESDIERRLRERIEQQRTLIKVALGYLAADQPHLAREILESMDKPKEGK